MGRLTDQPFTESCCDGGECSTTRESAQYCGCDAGANYKCMGHRYMQKDPDQWDLILDVLGAVDLHGALIEIKRLYEIEWMWKDLQK